VTDRQTDGQTDGFAIAYSALSMLSRAKNARIAMLELGSKQNMTGMITKWARVECIASTLVIASTLLPAHAPA